MSDSARGAATDSSDPRRDCAADTPATPSPPSLDRAPPRSADSSLPVPLLAGVPLAHQHAQPLQVGHRLLTRQAKRAQRAIGVHRGCGAQGGNERVGVAHDVRFADLLRQPQRGSPNAAATCLNESASSVIKRRAPTCSATGVIHSLRVAASSPVSASMVSTCPLKSSTLPPRGSHFPLTRTLMRSPASAGVRTPPTICPRRKPGTRAAAAWTA